MPTPIYNVSNELTPAQAIMYSKAAKEKSMRISTPFGIFRLSLEKESEGLEVTPELAKLIEKSREEIRQGKFTSLKTSEDIDRFFNSL
ncbi:MAG: hypothetical protein LBQ31_02085 [Bacteroidales bacterium]|jgi:hypothetical protein|nr:hypothetical protein [Bacteroidales bacterium]